MKYLLSVLAFSAVVLAYGQGLQTIVGDGVAGHWEFSSGGKASLGKNLKFIGKTHASGGVTNSDKALRFDVGSYASLDHGLSPNDSSGVVEEYALMFDFKFANTGRWYCLYQTDPTNKDDGDLFISPEGKIGVHANGYSFYKLSAGEWYRLVVNVDVNGDVSYFIDGQFSHKRKQVDNRFGLRDRLLLFADENGEDGEITVSQVALFDRVLERDEIKRIGGFGHNILALEEPIRPDHQLIDETSVLINWRSHDSTSTLVHYGLDMNNLSSIKKGTNKIGYHTVTIDNLKPGEEYYYRCINGWDTSGVYSFRTVGVAAEVQAEASDADKWFVLFSISTIVVAIAIYILFYSRKRFIRINTSAQQLKRQNERLKTILQYKEHHLWEMQLRSSTPFALINEQGSIVRCNDAFRKLVTHENNPVEGRPAIAYISDTSKQNWNSIFKRMLDVPDSVQFTAVEFVNKPNVPVDVEMADLRQDPSVQGFIVKVKLREQVEQEAPTVFEEVSNEDFDKIKKELAVKSGMLDKKNELLKKIQKKLNTGENPEVQSIINDLKGDNFSDKEWGNFQKHLESIDRGFLERLNVQHPGLTPKEQRYCAYIRMKLSTKEVAILMNVENDSVKKAKYRLSKKLKVSEDTSISKYLQTV